MLLIYLILIYQEEIVNESAEINGTIVNKQMVSLGRGVKIIKNGIDTQTVKLIESRQKQMAIQWCKKNTKLDMKINN